MPGGEGGRGARSQYSKRATSLSRQALIKKYTPVAVIGAVVLLVLWVRAKLY